MGLGVNIKEKSSSNFPLNFGIHLKEKFLAQSRLLRLQVGLGLNTGG